MLPLKAQHHGEYLFGEVIINIVPHWTFFMVVRILEVVYFDMLYRKPKILK